jgi:hypothetical protein
VTDHEVWETVMVTAPVIHELGSPPSREDSTGHVPFVFKLSGRLDGRAVRIDAVDSCHRVTPFVSHAPIMNSKF